jgi:hypothetical protein
MKAKLVPIYFKPKMDEDFKTQIKNLKFLLSEVADVMEPVLLGEKVPASDAVVFPVLSGDVYKKVNELKKIDVPFIVITTEFGTIDMWDWEIVSYLKSKSFKVFAPYNLELAKKICKSLALKRELKSTKFLVFQDKPGISGLEGEIFKRFFWWEDEFENILKCKFRINLIKKSFKELGIAAKKIPDEKVVEVIKKWNIKTECISDNALKSAIKIYIKVKMEIEKDSNIKGVGINCLNESFYSDTTPCLAWNMLYKEKKIIWACEADTLSLLTSLIIDKSLNAPFMMSNIYPFLIGSTALKHEGIDKFPEVNDPENYALVVHCGYFGVVPESFCTEWTLRPKVLEMVDKNATAIDARMPKGDITILKLDHTLTKLMVVEGAIVDYVQYPGSDCRNGALIRVENGYKLMKAFYSHHNCIISGHRLAEIEILSEVFDFELTGI